MKRLVRSISALSIAGLVGCNGAEQGAGPANVPPASPAAKTTTTEPAIREMKPAEKADEPRPAPTAKPAVDMPSDQLPELVPPAGAKDERSDAKPK